MKDDPIPGSDHIARYCSFGSLTENGRVSGTAFRLKPTDDGYLSVDWLDILEPSCREEQLRKVRLALSSRLKLGAKAKLAVLKVDGVIGYVRARSVDHRELIIKHRPLENDPSHSGIFNLRLEDDLIADLIAEAVSEDYPARVP